MNSRSYKLTELAHIIGGEVRGDGDTPIRGVAGIKEAAAGDITFFANPRYKEFLGTTRASALIVPPEIDCALPTIRLENPYLAFLKVLTMFAEPATERYPRGVHETAVVDPSAVLGRNVCIGPYCQVERGSSIADDTTLLLGTYIGRDVTVGRECLLYPNTVVRERTQIGDRVIIHPGAVIGADGFGFAKDGRVHKKVPQVGRVIIEDDVEIGANTTVDRATVGVTRICKGCKIDNLVQIAHNVVIGEHSIVAAQVGVSGSTELGEGVVIAGQAGLVGHIQIGDGAIIAAQTGVSNSVPAGTMVSGYPAREHSLARRVYALTGRLPELYKRIQELEKKLQDLKKGSPDGQAAENNR